MTTPITQGDREPAMMFTLSDPRGGANFAAVTADKVKIRCYVGKTQIIDSTATSVNLLSPNELQVTRIWQDGETAKPARVRVLASIVWAVGMEQTFPAMTLDIEPKNV